MGTEVVPLPSSRGALVRFWKAGLAPYAGDPHFVTPLRIDCFDRWKPSNPLFRHAEAQHFVAVRDGRDVGRIAAAVDREEERVHGEPVGNFGWFECEDDEETAHALLDRAAAWLRERGRTRVRGPLSYTTNGISGLLVEDRRPGPPVIDMAYNPPWYARLLESWGLEQVMDLLAYWAPTAERPPERFARVVARMRRRGGIHVRPFRTDRQGFAEDVDLVLDLYNRSWEKNWGFIPLSEAEIRHQAKSFRPILRPEFTFFAEAEGVPVGFLLALPDVNQALLPLAGRLWPWALVSFLRGLRRVTRIRVLTLGVVPEFRRKGIEAILIHDIFRSTHEHGLEGGECSWILADNELMIASLEQTGGSEYRRYRLYERSL